MEFSDTQKLAEVRRQLATWRRTYPQAVKLGTVSPHQAALHLRLWEAIEADYAARVGPRGFIAA